MPMFARGWLAILATALLVTACAPPTRGTAPSAAGETRASAGVETQRTMVGALRLEPNSLALRPPRETFSNVDHTRLFNADLANIDDTATPQPYLAEALPQLNTGTWKVFPDGRMETTYHLRPDLTWHDGAPLTA